MQGAALGLGAVLNRPLSIATCASCEPASQQIAHADLPDCLYWLAYKSHVGEDKQGQGAPMSHIKRALVTELHDQPQLPLLLRRCHKFVLQ